MPTRQDVVSDEREIEDGDIHEIQVRAPVNAPRHPEIDETQEERPAAETPLPKLQLFILLYIQLAEPITSTVIYPFVNQLVRKTGITGGDEDKTGYFAGLIVSITSERQHRSLCTDTGARNPPSTPPKRSVYFSGAVPRIALGESRS